MNPESALGEASSGFVFFPFHEFRDSASGTKVRPIDKTVELAGRARVNFPRRVASLIRPAAPTPSFSTSDSTGGPGNGSREGDLEESPGSSILPFSSVLSGISSRTSHVSSSGEAGVPLALRQ